MSQVHTSRLLLRPMSGQDADALFPIYSDPEIWWFDPRGVHGDIETTRAYAESVGSRWSADGLSYWTVHRGETDEVIGSGGAQRHRGGEWNLNYRIASAHQGRGYAGEVLSAAMQAATRLDSSAPQIAWIDEVNEPSIRVALRAGLVSRGLRSGTYDGRPRLAFADREIDDAVWAPLDPAGDRR